MILGFRVESSQEPDQADQGPCRLSFLHPLNSSLYGFATLFKL